MVRALVSVLAGSIMVVGVTAHTRPTGNYSRSDYTQWKDASLSTKWYVVQVAIGGIQTGWVYGSAHAQGEIAGYLASEYKRNALPERIVSRVGLMSVADPQLRYSRRVTYYVDLIDRSYERVPAVRSWDVPNLLLCLSDRPLPACPSSLKAMR